MTFPSKTGAIGGIAASGLLRTLVEGADSGRFLLELCVLVVCVVVVPPEPGVVGGVLAVGADTVGGVVAVVRDKKWFFVFSRSSSKFVLDEVPEAGGRPFPEDPSPGGVGNGCASG